MASATYLSIRKLCSAVFSPKEMLQFAPVTIPICDLSTQLLFSGVSTSLWEQSWETQPIYSLQPLGIDKMNAYCFTFLSHQAQNYKFLTMSTVGGQPMKHTTQSDVAGWPLSLMTMSIVGGQPTKCTNPSYVVGWSSGTQLHNSSQEFHS